MATYQDYQTLANKIYDFGNSVTVEVLNNPNDVNDKTIWTKVTTEICLMATMVHFIKVIVANTLW